MSYEALLRIKAKAVKSHPREMRMRLSSRYTHIIRPTTFLHMVESIIEHRALVHGGLDFDFFGFETFQTFQTFQNLIILLFILFETRSKPFESFEPFESF